MFKAISTIVFLGAATSTNAAEVKQIDMFNPKNFLKASTPANLMKGLVDLAQGKILKDGTVAFGSCDSDD